MLRYVKDTKNESYSKQTLAESETMAGEVLEVHSDLAGQWDGRISGPPETVYFARKVNPWH